MLGKDPKTKDNAKSNYSDINYSTTSTVDDSAILSNTSTIDVIANSTKDRSLANQSYVSDTEKTSSNSYIILVVFIIIAVVCIFISIIIIYFRKFRKRTKSNGQPEELVERPLFDTSITSV